MNKELQVYYILITQLVSKLFSKTRLFLFFRDDSNWIAKLQKIFRISKYYITFFRHNACSYNPHPFLDLSRTCTEGLPKDNHKISIRYPQDKSMFSAIIPIHYIIRSIIYYLQNFTSKMKTCKQPASTHKTRYTKKCVFFSPNICNSHFFFVSL